MNTLRPGYIPTGWTPGEALRVQLPREAGTRGAVYLESLDPLDVAPDPMTVAYVLFRYEDMAEVERWLQWWKDQRQ